MSPSASAGIVLEHAVWRNPSFQATTPTSPGPQRPSPNHPGADAPSTGQTGTDLCCPPHVTTEALRAAIENRELLIEYQPLVNLQTGEITATEALVRWHHPRLGILSPSSFIPCAESCGQIGPLGHWVLEQACKQRMAWSKLGVPMFPMMVNLSPMQLQDATFAHRVATILGRTGMPASMLQFELTEGALLQATDVIQDQLRGLRELRIELCLDDFGMGHASLHYLRSFQFHKLKIPREFVAGVTTEPRDAVIVKAVIDLGQKLGLGVIAEGIEALDQVMFLRAQGCNEGQGYLFSRPVGPDRLVELTAQDRSTRPMPIARTTRASLHTTRG